jgi:hypothetical protein
VAHDEALARAFISARGLQIGDEAPIFGRVMKARVDPIVIHA